MKNQPIIEHSQKDLDEMRPILDNLSKIYDLGDRDECSWKHLGHGIASILAFDTWTELIDYTVPNDDGSFEDDEDLNRELRYLWHSVEADIEEFGVQKFVDRTYLLSNFLKFLYVDTFYKESWLPYRKAIEAKGIKIKGDE